MRLTKRALELYIEDRLRELNEKPEDPEHGYLWQIAKVAELRDLAEHFGLEVREQ